MPNRFRVVAVPVLEFNFGIKPNLDKGEEVMTKFDPKLVKKVSHSKLIACSTEIGIKNADKVSKEVLIPAYLDAVEKVEGEGGTLSPNIVNMYNEIVVALGLDKEPEGQAAPEEKVEEAVTVAAEAKPAPAPISRKQAAVAVKNSPVSAPKPETGGQPSEKRKTKPRKYTRIEAMVDALASMKDGGSLDTLYKKASKLYMDKGGTDKLLEATFFVNIGLAAVKALGFIEITETEFKILVKGK